MTDYTKLVQDLRAASMLSSAWEQLFTDAADAIEELENALADECKECDYLVNENARLTTENEALQKRLVSALTALHLANEKMGYYGIQPYTEADGEDMISDWVKTLVHEELTIKEREYEALKADRDELATDLAAVGRALTSELEQQMPKQGEWVKGTDGLYHCSKCGKTAPYLDAFDGVIQYWEPLFFCNNCGADMRAKIEVQK
jgi:regulator of replication initiation timing